MLQQVITKKLQCNLVLMVHNNLLRPVLTTWKNTLLSPEKKSSDAQARLCIDQVFSNFLPMSHYPSNISFHNTSSMPV